MSGIMRQSFDDTNNAQETEILGGTDQTKIGNVGDRLKVDATVSAVSGSGVSAWSKKLRYDDMNASMGGVARGTSITAASGWNTVYTYSGTGYLASYILNIETKDGWAMRLIVDGEEIFGSAGILTTDMHSDAIYDVDDSGKSLNEMEESLGLMCGSHDRIIFAGPEGYPIRFDSSITIRISRVTGAATKKFNAGLVIIQKDT